MFIYEYDTSPDIDIVHHNFSNSVSLVVPPGKIFRYKLNEYTEISVNGLNLNVIGPSHQITSKSGDIITCTLANIGSSAGLFGYLVDEDYFKTDNGTSSGTGSGSSSGSGSNGNTLIYTTSGF